MMKRVSFTDVLRLHPFKGMNQFDLLPVKMDSDTFPGENLFFIKEFNHCILSGNITTNPFVVCVFTLLPVINISY